ncbi:MAG: MBL fold metallo-hydrolase [Promethearchaeota archaeon]
MTGNDKARHHKSRRGNRNAPAKKHWRYSQKPPVPGLPMKVRGPDKLLFLGSGGGRIHVAIQHLSTAGMIYRFHGTQAHIDPGPGSMVRLRQYKVNPRLTSLVVVTHRHTDHCHDAPVVVESMQENLRVKRGTLVSTKDYVEHLPDFYGNLLKEVVGLDPGESFTYRGTRIVATKTIHGDIPGVGFKFYRTSGGGADGTSPYVVGFTGDSEVFPGWAEQYADVDLLVLNLLRPDNIHCDRHLCTDEVIPYLVKAAPRAIILTHFGARMVSDWFPKSSVPRQVRKIEGATGIPTRAASDGAHFNIRKLLPRGGGEA